MQIAVGGEIVVLAVVGFVFAGQRASLGWALVATGVFVPVALYSTAGLYWDDTAPFTSEAFWTTAVIGSVAGLPLVLLGAKVLRGRDERERRRPAWLLAVRWLIFAGLWVVVFAFRAGEWDDGVVLVWAGGALALLGLALALPYRLGVGRRGVGRFLLFLGLAGAVVVLVAGAAVGGHMSSDEAVAGIVPALLVAALGGVLAAAPARPRHGTTGDGTREPDGRIDDTAEDLADGA